MLWSFRFWTIALTSFSPVLHFTFFPIQSNVCRALKPNGKLVLIDLEAVEESLRNTEDKIERLRVPSHMRNLSRAEMLAFYQTHDLPVECCEAVKPAVLQKWLDHTQKPQEVQMDILRQMEREITGGESPLLQRRKDSVRPLMDLNHRRKRRRAV